MTICNCLPLLRGLLRGLPGDGAAARLRGWRHDLPGQPLLRLPGLLLRLPVRAAARVRGERAAGLRRDPRRHLPGLYAGPACSGRCSTQRAGRPAVTASAWCWSLLHPGASGRGAPLLRRTPARAPSIGSCPTRRWCCPRSLIAAVRPRRVRARRVPLLARHATAASPGMIDPRAFWRRRRMHSGCAT